MNIARTIRAIHHKNVGQNTYRKFRFSAVNYQSPEASQPQVQEEKFDFENLKVIERVERRKPKIEPFMKNIFVSVFNRDLLAYSEILNKEDTEALDDRVNTINSVFSDRGKSKEERRNTLRSADMFAAPVSLTKGGLAMNHTESLRYLEVISSDIELGMELSDHWIGLEALRLGLSPENYNQMLGDLLTGDKIISLCIKEKINDRILQPDFRTTAQMNSQGIWYINGEKFCKDHSGYMLVLCSTDGGQLKMFLVHPGSRGVTHNGIFVTFMKTPATPLDNISEECLAKTLGVSRLHAATLCRSALSDAVRHCVDYVKPKVFSGKPLSELTTIRATIGEALLDIYACESAEYFTAGLLDGFDEPDAELEVAMCRNFIVNRGVTNMVNLFATPTLEDEQRCNEHINRMRHLSARGETLDSINLFIALNGIHHASKTLSQEVKQMRNPLMNPSFIMKKMFADRHQEKDQPKLTLYLAEHLHPSLRPPAESLEYCVLRMRYACETLMSRHGMEVATAFLDLNRLAEAATEILMMTSVLARASRSYCIGLRHSELEMKLAACFVEKSKDRVKKLILDLTEGEFVNLDHFTVQFGKKWLELNPADPIFVEKPTSRVFW